MKKTLALVWLLCVTATYIAQASPPPSFSQLPDFMTEDHCDPFSRSALKLLQQQNIPAHRIVYGWSQMGGLRSSHAAVLFQWEGRLYFMDNCRTKPRLVGGKTDLGCVNRITGDFYTHCWMVDDQGRRVAPRKMSELFPH